MLFVTPALGRLRQEECHELQASQLQSETLYQKEKKNQGASKKVEWAHTPLSSAIRVSSMGLTRGATPAGYPLTFTSLCPCTPPRAPVNAHSKGRDVGESQNAVAFMHTRLHRCSQGHGPSLASKWKQPKGLVDK